MKYHEYSELTNLADDDILLVQETKTLAIKRVKLSTLKQYISAATNTPTPINNIPNGYSLWLRADKGLVLDGSTVSTWQDQSSNQYNATQLIKASQPLLVANSINGLPALKFDGIDDYLFSDTGINVADSKAIFLVFKVNQFAAYKGLFSLRSTQYLDWNSADGMAISQAALTNQLSIDVGNAYNSNPGSDPVAITIPYQLNTWNIALFKMSANVAAMVLNSTVTQSDNYQINTVVNTGGYVISARGTDSNNANGRQFSFYGSNDIAEIIAYSRTLNSTEEQSIYSYLNTKYKIY